MLQIASPHRWQYFNTGEAMAKVGAAAPTGALGKAVSTKSAYKFY
jgi:hypothetical protein